uniref:Uncharacterized protein n=1 Tax=Ditylenchus dipsaci TaxID=166011 RepID=A0A915DWJ6_9BILA
MERVELVHTKKIGARTAPITYTDDGSGCYVWTKTGRTMEKDGFDQGYFNCSGCKAVNLANAVKVQVSSLKFNLTSSTWIDDPDQYNHICEPKATTTVTGTDLRRSFQAERAAGGGGQETSAAVRVRMDQRIVREHGNKTAQEQQEIRDAACGNVTATDAGLGITSIATWMSKGEIFCLFGYTGPRTTNHAESYHSKQRNHFSPHSKLANWIVSFRELTHTEELDALNVYEGRQVGRRQGRGKF